MPTRRAILLLTALLPSFTSGYTTYIGDESTYRTTALAADSAGATYIVSSRLATGDVVLTKLDPSGAQLFKQVITDQPGGQANGVAVDPSGNIYVAGTTSSSSFPLRNPLQSASGPQGTGFLMKFAPDASLIYSTYFGGVKGNSALTAIAIDTRGGIYVTGETDAVSGTYVSIWAIACEIGTSTGSLCVSYAGPAPGLTPGVAQINFQIPPNPQAVATVFSLTLSGASSDPASIFVAP